MPPSLAMPVTPTREFWMHVLEAKIEATIRDEGEMIGWEDDNETVGAGRPRSQAVSFASGLVPSPSGC
jgi:hypothetical protein